MAAAEWMELSEPAAAAMPPVRGPSRSWANGAGESNHFFKKFLPAQSNWERRRRLAGYYLKS
jgi:hypothetical protein